MIVTKLSSLTRLAALALAVAAAPAAVAQLSKQKPAPVAKVGIIGAKLMAVIAKRQRRREIAGRRAGSLRDACRQSN